MDILLTGSVAYDYLMYFPGYFKDHILPEHLDNISLSFLVDSMVKRRGGVAPNIAYTLALLGERPHILAAVGEDFEEYRAWLESKGVDTAGMRVIVGTYTASFFANTDRANNQIASFYTGAMAHSAELSLKDVQEQPDLVVISPNDPTAMRLYVDECRELGLPYLYDPSQQIIRLEGSDLRKGIENCTALFVNDYEFELLQKRTGMTAETIRNIPRFVVVTRGEEGASVYAEGQEYCIPVIPPEKIADPTGVGDAFRAGFLTGYCCGFDWEICGQMGVLAATYCLEQPGTQSHAYTPAEFVARFRKHFEDGGKLDKLLESRE